MFARNSELGFSVYVCTHRCIYLSIQINTWTVFLGKYCTKPAPRDHVLPVQLYSTCFNLCLRSEVVTAPVTSTKTQVLTYIYIKIQFSITNKYSYYFCMYRLHLDWVFQVPTPKQSSHEFFLALPFVWLEWEVPSIFLCTCRNSPLCGIVIVVK